MTLNRMLSDPHSGVNSLDLILMRLANSGTGLSLGGNLGEKVSLSWLTSPYFVLREKFKCIEHIGKSKIQIKTSPWNPENVIKLLPCLKALGWPLSVGCDLGAVWSGSALFSQTSLSENLGSLLYVIGSGDKEGWWALFSHEIQVSSTAGQRTGSTDRCWSGSRDQPETY